MMGEDFATDLSVVDEQDTGERAQKRVKKLHHGPQLVGRVPTTDLRALVNETEQVSQGRAASANLPFQQQQEDHTPRNHTLQEQADTKQATGGEIPEQAAQKEEGGAAQGSSGARPGTPDIIRELEDLMGGMEAMVSTVNFDADAVAEGDGEKKDKNETTAPPEAEHRGEVLKGADSQEITGKPMLWESDVASKEERQLHSPLKSPRQPTDDLDLFHTDQDLKAASKTGRAKTPEQSGTEWYGDQLKPGFSPAVSPEQQKEDVGVIIDPPSPWGRGKQSPSPDWQEPGFSGPEDNLADVSKPSQLL